MTGCSKHGEINPACEACSYFRHWKEAMVELSQKDSEIAGLKAQVEHQRKCYLAQMDRHADALFGQAKINTDLERRMKIMTQQGLPDMVESERKANEIMTDELARKDADIADLKSELLKLKLVSGYNVGQGDRYRKRIENLCAALERCLVRFREYEAIHLSKIRDIEEAVFPSPNMVAREKAAANAAMAEMCRVTLEENR